MFEFNKATRTLTISCKGELTKEIVDRCLEKISCDREKIKNIIIARGVTSIGKGTFEDYDNLLEITIPEGVTTIKEYAFWGCENLEEILLTDKITSVGEVAFSDCKKLTIYVNSEPLKNILMKIKVP